MSYLHEQIADLQAQLADLKASQVRYVNAPVVENNEGESTFAVRVNGPNGGTTILRGLDSSKHMLPEVGSTARLALVGGQPVFQPGDIAENAIGERELSTEVVEKIDVTLETANGKNEITFAEIDPSDTLRPGKNQGDIWWKVAPGTGLVIGSWIWGGAVWVPTKFGDATLDSLNVGKLVTGSIAAGSRIVAGNINGTHAAMESTGFRVYRAQTTGGPVEVARMGTQTNDYFGIVGADGNLKAAIDDTGRVNAAAMTTENLTVRGIDVMSRIDTLPRGPVAHFRQNPGFDLGPIFWGLGIAEVGAAMYFGRAYRVSYRMMAKGTTPDEVLVSLRYTSGAANDVFSAPPAPNQQSPAHTQWSHFIRQTDVPQLVTGETTFIPDRTSRFRLGITAQRGAYPSTSGNRFFVVNNMVEITVTDIGPAPAGVTGIFSTMGGTVEDGATQPPPPPATPTQQYFVDLAPSGRASWNGSGQLMTWAGGDVYQGYDSSNGDTRGQFWFDLPNITGTVDRVDIWIYFRHWWFNSGGTVRMGITDQRGTFTGHSFKPLWESTGWPKPGGRELLVPLDWYPLFRGTNNNSLNGRGTCITLGPGGGTNQIYYGVATDARLRIYYTQ